MPTVVKHHYPVSKLPGDLREAVKGARSVSVTLVPDNGEHKSVPFSKIQTRIAARKRKSGFAPVKAAQAVDRIRTLRDEWD